MVTQRNLASAAVLSCRLSIVAVLLMVVSDFKICAQPTSEGKDFEKWEAPRELKEAFPYYVSGLDNKGQPVFVVEYGKWNVRKYLEDGGDPKTLNTYTDQMMLMFNRWSEAGRNSSSSGNSTGTGLFAFIVDFEGYDSRQLTHLPSLAFAMEIGRKFYAGPARRLAYGNLIKMSPVAQVLMTHFVRPLVGDTFSKVKSIGKDKKDWVPLLLEKIPKDSLPDWYGGSPSFEPLAVFG